MWLVIAESQRRLIRESFGRLRPAEAGAGELFYELLFATTPRVAQMFAGVSIPEQGGKLMQVLAYVVDEMEGWVGLAAQVEELGARHAGYGVKADHYAAVGTALMKTLKALLGEDFTADTEEAWEELYTDVSLVMERGARRARVTRPEGRKGVQT